MIRHFFQRDFNVTPNSTVAYKRTAVEAPDLGDRYSLALIDDVPPLAVEAPDLGDRYSSAFNLSFSDCAVEAPDLGDRYSLQTLLFLR